MNLRYKYIGLNNSESKYLNKCLLPNCFNQRMAGEAMLAIVSRLMELTTKARRQPVKVVKLAGPLASVVGSKKTTKTEGSPGMKTLAL